MTKPRFAMGKLHHYDTVDITRQYVPLLYNFIYSEVVYPDRQVDLNYPGQVKIYRYYLTIHSVKLAHGELG